MKRLWLLFAQAVTLLLAIYLVVKTMRPEWLMAMPGATHATLSINQTPNADNVDKPVPVGSFRVAAQRAASAVVSINTRQQTAAQDGDAWLKFLFGDRGNEPDNRRTPEHAGTGSGVIVSDTGYILTNNHVIEEASQIEVVLNDTRRATAKVIGTDPESDLALLKIELDSLPVITWGDAESLSVGDQVLAIGNPFGVGQTVTSGIVSALGKAVGINTFENFIQTDAAINPGNSGGALVDVNGHLIGINTAIYSRSGGSLGIGFAIPVSTAQQVMQALVADGQVTRGWIGVEPQELTPELAQAFNIKATTGVMIVGMVQDGPAAKAGLLPGDVVQQIGDKTVSNLSQLLTTIASIKPGTPTSFQVSRKDETLTVTVVPGRRPTPPTRR